MLVGVPNEIKDNEYRVGIVTPPGRDPTLNGHEVLIETVRAGQRSFGRRVHGGRCGF